MYTDFLGGGGEFSAGGIFYGDNFPWGGKFPGGELSKGNFTRGIGQDSYSKFFYLSYFLFTDSILHVKILRGIVRGKYLPDWNCLEYLSVKYYVILLVIGKCAHNFFDGSVFGAGGVILYGEILTLGG